MTPFESIIRRITQQDLVDSLKGQRDSCLTDKSQLATRLAVYQTAGDEKDKAITELRIKVSTFQNLAQDANARAQQMAEGLANCLNGTPMPTPEETAINSKYPPAVPYYVGRYIPRKGGNLDAIGRDCRSFLYWQDYPRIQAMVSEDFGFDGVTNRNISKAKTNDEKALECLFYVRRFLTYNNDEIEEGVPDYWQDIYETIQLRVGDCEDGAILLANIMLASGIPYYRVRLCAGDVVGGGHAYVTYARESDNRFVVLDWCYWVNNLPVAQRKPHSEEEKYKTIWFSWNKKYGFAQQDRITSLQSKPDETHGDLKRVVFNDYR